MTTKWTSKSVTGSDSGSPPPGTFGDQFVVLLLFGKNSFGDKIYSYLKITLANLPRLKSAILTGQGFNPSDFGEVVAAGKGEPVEAVRNEIASMYQVLDPQKPTKSLDEFLSAEKKAWDEY